MYQRLSRLKNISFKSYIKLNDIRGGDEVHLHFEGELTRYTEYSCKARVKNCNKHSTDIPGQNLSLILN